MEYELSIALHPSVMIGAATGFGLFAGRLSDWICHNPQGLRASVAGGVEPTRERARHRRPGERRDR